MILPDSPPVTVETVTSLSGGATSSYMAMHYPTDRYVFAPVLSDDPACVVKDKKLREYCQQKVTWFDWSRGGCREIDQTLALLRELEQRLGSCVEWVSAPFTIDQTIRGQVDRVIAPCFDRSATKTGMLPNSRARFCTQAHKIFAIGWHVWLTGTGYPCLMNIGFRADEAQRADGWTCDKDKMRVPTRCDISGSYAGKNRHEWIDYRISDFPLIRDGITKRMVQAFWIRQGWQFPTVSNCDFCFFHKASQHRHQADLYPDQMQWWINMEKDIGATFGKKSLQAIINDPQESLFEPDLEQFSCHCTD